MRLGPLQQLPQQLALLHIRYPGFSVSTDHSSSSYTMKPQTVCCSWAGWLTPPKNSSHDWFVWVVKWLRMTMSCLFSHLKGFSAIFFILNLAYNSCTYLFCKPLLIKNRSWCGFLLDLIKSCQLWYNNVCILNEWLVLCECHNNWIINKWTNDLNCSCQFFNKSFKGLNL